MRPIRDIAHTDWVESTTGKLGQGSEAGTSRVAHSEV